MDLKKRFLFGKTSGKRGQVWVETVIYTLIAFTLMGLVLAFVVPKVEETRDKGIIEQSIKVLEDIDSFVRLLGIPGNQRVFDLSINKGSLTFDAVNDSLVFEIESKYTYSESDEQINVGNIMVITEKIGDLNDITLTRDYSGKYNITFENSETIEKIDKASLSYNVIISNRGQDANGLTIINFEIQ